MSNLSEEEILIKIDEIIEYSKLTTDIGIIDQTEKIEAIQGLLDLYNKEKEKNKELSETNKKLYETGLEIGKQHIYTSKNYISKDKIREKIKEIFKRNTFGISKAIDNAQMQILQELLEE